jgi:ADP-ribosylglycohydrolase
MHDVLDPCDLVPDEAEQLASSGYPADTLWEQAREQAGRRDVEALERTAEQLRALRRSPGWDYVEPSNAQQVLSALPPPPAPVRVDAEVLGDRLRGAWLGRCLANTMGKPVEGLRRDEVEVYLRAVDQWPQTGFLPLLDELPEGVSHLHESAPESAAGRFTQVPRDDDLDWTILGLHMVETYGTELTADDIAREWLDRLPFTQTFTAERAAYRNLLHGLRAPATATRQNPYREWIGALIRADIWGYVFAGDPRQAALHGLRDAQLSHTANGLYGEMWAAALVAQALVTESAEQALAAAVVHVPTTSRLGRSQRDLLAVYREGTDLHGVMAWFERTLGHYNWVHAVNNAALIAIGLLWGEDFTGSVGVAVAGGRDTDSNAATVGSVFGALHGLGSVPASLTSQIDGTVRSAVRGFDGVSIAALAERTLRLVEQRVRSSS